ncbi:MAG TPA: glutamine--fructose-6-phosphate transaminase (isomerizing) [Dehalococcoidia bacterium]
MCGIIGYVGQQAAVPILLNGLQSLEYRGYDSAGIAVMNGGEFTIHKAAGKLQTLVAAMAGKPIPGSMGIGHTRWATHGAPNDTNAHPHTDCTGEVVVIHNGIVENYLALRQRLLAEGHRFQSDTDTEVIPHLIESHLAQGHDLVTALRLTVGELEGAHAIAAMSARETDRIVAARVGHAGGIVTGYGRGEMFLASDLPAILPHTRTVAYLEDRQVVCLRADGAEYYDAAGARLAKQPQTVPYDPIAAAKGNYKHFMLKEIYEQPQSVTDTVRSRVRLEAGSVAIEDLPLGREVLARVRRVLLIGMGTSLHAAMAGRTYVERIAGIPAEVDNASEFRYREPIIDGETLVVAVTQSGETVDTLAGMNQAKRAGAPLVAVCNVVGSEASRIADGVVYTRCGLEIGVASTKTYTASMAALYLLACYLAQERGTRSPEELRALLADLGRVPEAMGRALEAADQYEALAHRFFKAGNFLFLGRGVSYPVALEGALKLKEISYIHAEGYPAGEMKHGPIALIDETMPVVAICPRDAVYDKILSNVEEARARDGVVIAVATEGDTVIPAKAAHTVFVPELPPLLSPFVTCIPLQLLAYHIAVRRGCDVDQPRNLAKTVTVE